MGLMWRALRAERESAGSCHPARRHVTRQKADAVRPAVTGHRPIPRKCVTAKVT